MVGEQGRNATRGKFISGLFHGWDFTNSPEVIVVIVDGHSKRIRFGSPLYTIESAAAYIRSQLIGIATVSTTQQCILIMSNSRGVNSTVDVSINSGTAAKRMLSFEAASSARGTEATRGSYIGERVPHRGNRHSRSLRIVDPPTWLGFDFSLSPEILIVDVDGIAHAVELSTDLSRVEDAVTVINEALEGYAIATIEEQYSRYEYVTIVSTSYGSRSSIAINSQSGTKAKRMLSPVAKSLLAGDIQFDLISDHLASTFPNLDENIAYIVQPSTGYMIANSINEKISFADGSWKCAAMSNNAHIASSARQLDGIGWKTVSLVMDEFHHLEAELFQRDATHGGDTLNGTGWALDWIVVVIHVQHCRPGQSLRQLLNTVSCESCQRGTYSPDGGRCRKCPSGTIPNRQHAACIACPSGRYPFVGKIIECKQCTTAQFEDRSHYLNTDFCPGTTHSAGKTCKPLFAGFLCHSRKTRFRRSRDGQCMECDASRWTTVILLVAGLLILFIGAACLYCSRQRSAIAQSALVDSLRTDMLAQRERNSMRESASSIEGVSFALEPQNRIWRLRYHCCCTPAQLQLALRCVYQPLRIVITHLQVTSRIGSVLHIQFPPTFSALMKQAETWMDAFSLISPECEGLSGFGYKWMLHVVCLPVCMCLIVLAKYLQERTMSFDRKTSKTTTAYTRLKGNLLFVAFFCYPGICNIAFGAFNCIKLNNAALPASVLASNDQVVCDQIRLWQLLSAAVIAVVGCGMPLVFGTKLIRKARAHAAAEDATSAAQVARRVATLHGKSTEVTAYIIRDLRMGEDYSFLMDAYKPRYIYWETLEILRKFILVGMMVLVGTGSVDQILCSAILCVAFMILQVNCNPYKIGLDNAFRLITEVQVFVTILVAFALRGSASNDLYNLILIVSFVICVPGALLVTFICKVRMSLKRLQGQNTEAAFDRFELGLESDEDRLMLDAHFSSVRATIDAEAEHTHVTWLCAVPGKQFQRIIDTECQRMLESAHSIGQHACIVPFDGHTSTADLELMTLAATPIPYQLSRRVLTPHLSDITVPASWWPMPPGLLCLKVKLDETTAAGAALFDRIQQRVISSLPNYRVTNIERLQNLTLWHKYQQFCWNKRAITHDSSAPAYERELFHWAPPTVVDKIFQSGSVGFDPRIGRGEYGAGTYFAEHAIYPVALAQDWLFAGLDPTSFGTGGKWGGSGPDLPLGGSINAAAKAAIAAERTASKRITLIWGRVALGHCKDFGARCASGRGDAAADAQGVEAGLPEWPRMGDGQGLNRPPPAARGRIERQRAVRLRQRDRGRSAVDHAPTPAPAWSSFWPTVRYLPSRSDLSRRKSGFCTLSPRLQ
eukprot:COSAG01_NODE_3973_length_5478_cov_1.317531_2_plen_1348_part_00